MGSHITILISANGEWKSARSILSPENVNKTPFGEVFIHKGFRYFQGGWGKVSAAASTQFVIDHYSPQLLVNLGTCGGFKGRVERGTIIVVNETVIYDISELMTDPLESISFYTSRLDPARVMKIPEEKLPDGTPVIFARMLSADRDLNPGDIPGLISRYGAIAADWESGSIGWVAGRNNTPCLILRGVTDLVDESGGEAYHNPEVFFRNTTQVMEKLIELLPSFIF